MRTPRSSPVTVARDLVRRPRRPRPCTRRRSSRATRSTSSRAPAARLARLVVAASGGGSAGAGSSTVRPPGPARSRRRAGRARPRSRPGTAPRRLVECRARAARARAAPTTSPRRPSPRRLDGELVGHRRRPPPLRFRFTRRGGPRRRARPVGRLRRRPRSRLRLALAAAARPSSFGGVRDERRFSAAFVGLRHQPSRHEALTRRPEVRRQPVDHQAGGKLRMNGMNTIGRTSRRTRCAFCIVVDMKYDDVSWLIT